MATNRKAKQPITKEPKVSVSAATKAVRVSDFKSLYLNNIQFGFTRFDFQMVLGLVEISKTDEYMDTLQETACVKMTPGYAKALLSDLAATLSQYEASYGEIPIPTPLDQPLTKAK